MATRSGRDVARAALVVQEVQVTQSLVSGGMRHAADAPAGLRVGRGGDFVPSRCMATSSNSPGGTCRRSSRMVGTIRLVPTLSTHIATTWMRRTTSSRPCARPPRFVVLFLGNRPIKRPFHLRFDWNEGPFQTRHVDPSMAHVHSANRPIVALHEAATCAYVAAMAPLVGPEELCEGMEYSIHGACATCCVAKVPCERRRCD